MKTVTAVLVGAGGYGQVIWEQLRDHTDVWGIRIVGVVEPYIDKLPAGPEIAALGIPVYETLEAFYRHHTADLAVICSPIHFHREHALLALEKGSHCLCEKPAAATLAQALEMETAARRAKRQLHIGFQYCYLPAIRQLKADIDSGCFGKPLFSQATVCWPRGSAYFARPWCARRSVAGMPVNDSILMNACAHYLQLQLYLLGAPKVEECKALLLRGNAIETFDTALLQLNAGGVPVHHFVTHCSQTTVNPQVQLVFEKATVEIREGWEADSVQAVFPDGSRKLYGPVKPDLYEKLFHCAEAVRGSREPVCTVAEVAAHLGLVQTLTEKCPVHPLPGTVQTETLLYRPGLEELFMQAYETKTMPWELTDTLGTPETVTI